MDILDIIGNYGITIPEDQQENLRKDVLKSYKSVNEYNKVVGERDTLVTAKQNYETQVGALTTKVSAYETDINKMSSQLNGYICKEKVTKAGIDQSFVGYVTHEVNQLVTETKDFDTALNEYIEGNPQFKAGQKIKVKSGPTLGGNGGEPKTTSQKMTEAILVGAGKK